MSIIRRQIDEMIKDNIFYQESGITTLVNFNQNFIGFIGHFPNNPILPGVIIIKIMTRMYELYNHKNFTLSQIKQAKFIEPISADSLVSFFVKSNIEKGFIKLNGKVLKSDKVISKISLILQK